jgi:hypothetical protein
VLAFEALAPPTAYLGINAMLDPVTEALGNTPAIARKSYVHPRLIDLAKDQGRAGRVPRGLAPAARHPLPQSLRARTDRLPRGAGRSATPRQPERSHDRKTKPPILPRSRPAGQARSFAAIQLGLGPVALAQHPDRGRHRHRHLLRAPRDQGWGVRLCKRGEGVASWYSIFGRAVVEDRQFLHPDGLDPAGVTGYAGRRRWSKTTIQFLFTIAAVFQCAIWVRELIFGRSSIGPARTISRQRPRQRARHHPLLDHRRACSRSRWSSCSAISA